MVISVWHKWEAFVKKKPITTSNPVLTCLLLKKHKLLFYINNKSTKPNKHNYLLELNTVNSVETSKILNGKLKEYFLSNFHAYCNVR